MVRYSTFNDDASTLHLVDEFVQYILQHPKIQVTDMFNAFMGIKTRMSYANQLDRVACLFNELLYIQHMEKSPLLREYSLSHIIKMSALFNWLDKRFQGMFPYYYTGYAQAELGTLHSFTQMKNQFQIMTSQRVCMNELKKSVAASKIYNCVLDWAYSPNGPIGKSIIMKYDRPVCV